MAEQEQEKAHNFTQQHPLGARTRPPRVPFSRDDSSAVPTEFSIGGVASDTSKQQPNNGIPLQTRPQQVPFRVDEKARNGTSKDSYKYCQNILRTQKEGKGVDDASRMDDGSGVISKSPRTTDTVESISDGVEDGQAAPFLGGITVQAAELAGASGPLKKSGGQRNPLVAGHMSKINVDRMAVPLSNNADINTRPQAAAKSDRKAVQFDEWKRRTDQEAAAVLAAARIYRGPSLSQITHVRIMCAVLVKKCPF